MHTLTSSILSLVALLCATAGWAAEERSAVGEAETNQVLQVALDLSDGSRIIGVPSIQSVPVETSYAKMDIMLKQIRSMKIGADHETVAIDLQSGALYFDGMDDYLDAGNPPSLQLSTNFTLTAWIRPERTADSSGIITKSHG